MKVRTWMKRAVHSVKPLDSIERARELMETHRVNQLPVAVDGRLVGIITDRDLRDAFPSVFDFSEVTPRTQKVGTANPRAVTVNMVMTSNVRTVEADHSMADAARLMRRERIGALPVVDGDRLVGIITRSDVLECFSDLVELGERHGHRRGGAERANAKGPRTRSRTSPSSHT